MKTNIFLVIACCLCIQTAIAQTNSGIGGGVFLNGGRLEGCLVKTNSAAGEGSGVYLAAGEATSSTIADNTSTAGSGVFMESGSILSNSIAYGNGDSDSDGTGSITNSLTNGTDPKFVGSGNYRLTETSPCINTGGTAAPGLLYDLDLNPRVYGSKIDMGAYEYQAAVTGGTGIQITNPAINDTVIETRYYTMDGTEIRQPEQTGIYIVKKIYQSQKTEVTKVAHK